METRFKKPNFPHSTKDASALVSLSPGRITSIRDRYLVQGDDYILTSAGFFFTEDALEKLKNRNTTRGAVVAPIVKTSPPKKYSVDTQVLADALGISHARAYELVGEQLKEGADYWIGTGNGKAIYFLVTPEAVEKLRNRPFQGKGGNRKKAAKHD
jgi:hypothetical protein